jgi:hypothetical protein
MGTDPMTRGGPDPALVTRLLSRYAPARLRVPLDHLADGDRRALGRLMDAASWIDRIYWTQRSDDGWSLKERLAGSCDPAARDLERLLSLNFGPWDEFDGGRPFWGDRARPPGGTLYPPDLTREELDGYLARHPAERRALLGPTTLIRRQGDRLVAIPYAEAYREELAHIAGALREAAELATHAPFRTFLHARADDLVSGSLRRSDALWIDAADSPIDVAIGPYEVYDDAFLGLKTSYEATILVRHPLTGRLRELRALAPELERKFPGAAPAEPGRRVEIGVYDVVHVAGMTNVGGKAVAAMLPNDERVRAEVGARLLLFRNVIAAKFGPIMKALAARSLRADQLELVREEAFLDHTLLHEMAHALSSGLVRRGSEPAGITVNEALRERYSAIEECRAELLGLVFLLAITSRPRDAEAAVVTFVANSIRTLRFGAADDYGRGAAVVLSHLLRCGGLEPGPDGRLGVALDEARRGIAELAEIVQDIATRGDYEAAGALLDDLGSVPAEIERLLPRFSDVPIDLELVVDRPGREL